MINKCHHLSYRINSIEHKGDLEEGLDHQSSARNPVISIFDIIRCSRFISGSNNSLMASAVSISDNELQEIKRNHPQKHGQALQIIYKWQEKNPNSSIEELQMFLFSVGEPHAANSLMDPEYRSKCHII